MSLSSHASVRTHDRARQLVASIAVAALVVVGIATPTLAAKPTKLVDVQLIAFNDFHGNLLPPSGSSGRVGNVSSSQTDADCGTTVPNCALAGGVAYLADDVKALEATNPNTLVVSAGDNIGASPLISAAFHDEPTIEALNELGLDFAAVGNHEFDEGVSELLRIQNGGCHPVDGCDTGHTYAGADFQYLAANVVYKNNGKPIFPAYKTRSFAGARIGIIGLTLEGTPSIVSAAGIQNVNFLDEATSINKAVAELKQKKVHTIVVLIHEGGAQSASFSTQTINSCTGFGGAISGIVSQLDDEVDLVVSGHTHNAYNCMLPNSVARDIPVSSASSFGRLVTDIDMTINKTTDQPTSISVDNQIVFRDVADANETALVDYYTNAVAPIANAVVGSITADITRTNNSNGESALGDVIADAQLEYAQSQNAVIAFMNPGGIRTDLVYNQISGGEAPGEVTYGEAFAVQPFNNIPIAQDMTGQQIKDVLEESFQGCLGRTQATVILQVSAGFNYTYDPALGCGSRITAITLNGNPLVMGDTYRVTMNNFLADGGDSFPGMKAGTNRENLAGFDIDAFAQYLGAHAPVAPGPQNRITKL